MVPKIIHYCWFGNKEMDSDILNNIKDWKKKNPDFKIVKWNENKFNIGKSCQFVRDAYAHRDWAFVSDYVRLYAIFKYGGIYLDTDVKLLKPLHTVLEDYPGGYMGFENEDMVASGLGFAAEKDNPIIKEMLVFYQRLKFDSKNLSKIACPIVNTKILRKHGLICNNTKQMIQNIEILPTDYLCPIDIYSGDRRFTENTISVHMYKASWMNNYGRLKMYAIFYVKRILPQSIVAKIRNSIRKLQNK